MTRTVTDILPNVLLARRDPHVEPRGAILRGHNRAVNVVRRVDPRLLDRLQANVPPQMVDNLRVQIESRQLHTAPAGVLAVIPIGHDDAPPDAAAKQGVLPVRGQLRRRLHRIVHAPKLLNRGKGGDGMDGLEPRFVLRALFVHQPQGPRALQVRLGRVAERVLGVRRIDAPTVL